MAYEKLKGMAEGMRNQSEKATTQFTRIQVNDF
jgi:hypothetical protein